MLIGKPSEVEVTGVSQVQLSKFTSAVDKTLETQVMADVKTPEGTPPVTVVNPPVEPAAKDVVTPVTPPVAPVIDATEAIVAKAVEASIAKLMPMFEGITTSVQALAQTVDGLVVKMATPVEPSQPPQPTNDDKLVEMQKTISGLTANLQSQQKIVEDVKKGLSSLVPGTPPRDDSTKPPKKNDDPNNVFNSFFGISAKT